MTLNTSIYITGTGVTMHEVCAKVNDLLGIPKDRSFTETETEICNGIGQGFPAIVRVSCNKDGALDVHEPHDDKWCMDPEEPCDWDGHVELHHVRVNLDTAYSYRNEKGWDCSRLHAYVILSLADWLSDRERTVRWVNEYEGTVHDATDREAFERFIGNGDDASDWFFGTVLPAIETSSTEGTAS